MRNKIEEGKSVRIPAKAYEILRSYWERTGISIGSQVAALVFKSKEHKQEERQEGKA